MIELEEKYQEDLKKEFHKNFFKMKSEILKKEKEILALERDSDFSESEYEFYMKKNIEKLNEEVSNF